MNLHYLFHREYYKELSERHFAKCNSALYQAQFGKEDSDEAYRYSLGNCLVHLKTTYPGALVGISTDLRAMNGEEPIEAGMSFDYTSGMPYIPGAMVKGILRACFRYPEMIFDLIGRRDIDIEALEKEIFGALNNDERTTFVPKDKKDIFFDAVMVRGNKQGKFLAPEFWTTEQDILQPRMLQRILKIRPKVCFLFRFNLHDGIITAEEKKNLFEELLIIHGIGARTSVGYGALKKAKRKSAAHVMKESLIDELRYTFWAGPEDEEREMLEQKVMALAVPEQKKVDVVCACGAKNIKYNNITGKVNDSWKRKVCFRCGADLTELVQEAEENEQTNE